LFVLNNFKIGAHAAKTLLLFVIRDHVPSESPLTALQEMIENDMKDIWKDIQKVKFCF
jgi:hypothetical protein